MTKLERVARAIAIQCGNDADEWERFVVESDAAIDAMQEDIQSADKAAREECAAICRERANIATSDYMFIDLDVVARTEAAKCCKAILDTIK